MRKKGRNKRIANQKIPLWEFFGLKKLEAFKLSLPINFAFAKFIGKILN